MHLRAIPAAQGGNVVITFALATIPIIGFVGAAVDYSRANSAKAAMQAAVDSTALMLSKDAQTLTTAQLNQKAIAYFQALFNRTEVSEHRHHPDLHEPPSRATSSWTSPAPARSPPPSPRCSGSKLSTST